EKNRVLARVRARQDEAVVRRACDFDSIEMKRPLLRRRLGGGEQEAGHQGERSAGADRGDARGGAKGCSSITTRHSSVASPRPWPRASGGGVAVLQRVY